jgi:hypothetical protein
MKENEGAREGEEEEEMEVEKAASDKGQRCCRSTLRLLKTVKRQQ